MVTNKQGSRQIPHIIAVDKPGALVKRCEVIQDDVIR